LLAGVRVGPRRIRVRGADVERFLAEAAAAQGRPGRAYVIPSLSRPAASGTSAALDPPAKTIGQAPDRRARLVRSRSPRRDGLGAVASRPVTGTRDQRGELACALDAVAAAVERLCRVLEQEAAGDVA
jgi:hypothetical protein